MKIKESDANMKIRMCYSIQIQDQSLYWTDDLPVCQLSGVGSATNQIYRDDGYRREEHDFEDRSFRFK